MNKEETTLGTLIIVMLLGIGIVIGLCSHGIFMESESKSHCVMKDDDKLCIDYYITKDWYVEKGSKND